MNSSRGEKSINIKQKAYNGEYADGLRIVLQWKVESECQLLSFLKLHLNSQSISSVKEQLKRGCVLVNDRVSTQFDDILSPGDTVKLVSKHQKKYAFSHPLLKIIYEDDALIVVEKGSGLHSVDATHGGVENACGLLENYVRRRYPERRIYVVHRLDRDTSGVMMFAKTRMAQDILVKNWRRMVTARRYIAITEGTPQPDVGTIDSYLYEDAHKVMHVASHAGDGMRAVTHYRVMAHSDRYAMLSLHLETGRTNQIRVHLQSIGHPIVGDLKYRAKTDPIHRLSLHAASLCFIHPLTHKKLAFESPLPDAFQQLMPDTSP